jgi:hypothetical protein
MARHSRARHDVALEGLKTLPAKPPAGAFEEFMAFVSLR